MTTEPAPTVPRPRAKASPRAGRFVRALADLWLRFYGWKVDGTLPDDVKAVAIAYPHTTNWDLPFMLAVSYRLGVRPSWLGKRQLFRFPFGGLMRFLGGLPVDRGARTNLVAQVVERFDEVDRLFLVIPPSGTRKRAPHWKSGFYHIARGASVPILCTYLDYARKIGGIGLVLTPTGDVRADMDAIRGFYEGIEGLYPKQQTPIFLPEEHEEPTRAAGGGAHQKP